jgi:hypothetical protein
LKRQNETVEQREQRLAKVRANYKENKGRRSGKNKQCPPSGSRGHLNNDNGISHNSVSQLIHKFHKSVSTGQLFHGRHNLHLDYSQVNNLPFSLLISK